MKAAHNQSERHDDYEDCADEENGDIYQNFGHIHLLDDVNHPVMFAWPMPQKLSQ
jgi:hypothetical protein